MSRMRTRQTQQRPKESAGHREEGKGLLAGRLLGADDLEGEILSRHMRSRYGGGRNARGPFRFPAILLSPP